MNCNTVLFHPSQLGRLWTEPKDKAARENGELSATSKAYLSEVTDKKWVANIYINGRQKYIGSFETELEAGEAYQNKLKTINK